MNSEMVRKCLCKLKLEYGAPSGSVPLAVFKILSFELAEPLSILFSKIIQDRIIPASWLNADITPVYKKNDPSLAINYRPISITVPVSRIFETVVFKDQLLWNFRSRGLISMDQFGFLSGKSPDASLCQRLD